MDEGRGRGERPALAALHGGDTYTVPPEQVAVLLERLPALRALYERWAPIGGGVGSMIVADPSLAAAIVRLLDEGL